MSSETPEPGQDADFPLGAPPPSLAKEPAAATPAEPPAPAPAPQAPAAAQPPYPQPGYPQPGYPQPAYPQPGYGQAAYPPAAGMPVPSPDGESDKTFLVTWLLSLLVGAFGVDRFYLGKIGTGIAKLLTCGGCGVWWLIDLILVLTNSTKDKYGRRLAGYEQHKKVAWIVSAVVVALSLLSSALQAPDRIARINANADSAVSQLDELQEDAAAAPEEPAEEPVEEDVAEEPVAEEPAAEQGTRENPLPLGTPVTVEDYDGPAWEVTLGAPTYDATEAVRAANQFNEEAPAGLTYVVVPVTVTRLGAAAEAPWIGLNIEYVTASGTTHTSADTMAVAPEPTFNDINELYTGASGAGNVVLAVPTGDAGTGAWKISAMFGDEVFVAGS